MNTRPKIAEWDFVFGFARDGASVASDAAVEVDNHARSGHFLCRFG